MAEVINLAERRDARRSRGAPVRGHGGPSSSSISRRRSRTWRRSGSTGRSSTSSGRPASAAALQQGRRAATRRRSPPARGRRAARRAAADAAVWPERFPADVPAAMRVAAFATEHGRGAAFAIAAGAARVLRRLRPRGPRDPGRGGRRGGLEVDDCLRAARDPRPRPPDRDRGPRGCWPPAPTGCRRCASGARSTAGRTALAGLAAARGAPGAPRAPRLAAALSVPGLAPPSAVTSMGWIELLRYLYRRLGRRYLRGRRSSSSSSSSHLVVAGGVAAAPALPADERPRARRAAGRGARCWSRSRTCSLDGSLARLLGPVDAGCAAGATPRLAADGVARAAAMPARLRCECAGVSGPASRSCRSARSRRGSSASSGGRSSSSRRAAPSCSSTALFLRFFVMELVVRPVLEDVARRPARRASSRAARGVRAERRLLLGLPVHQHHHRRDRRRASSDGREGVAALGARRARGASAVAFTSRFELTLLLSRSIFEPLASCRRRPSASPRATWGRACRSSRPTRPAASRGRSTTWSPACRSASACTRRSAPTSTRTSPSACSRGRGARGRGGRGLACCSSTSATSRRFAERASAREVVDRAQRVLRAASCRVLVRHGGHAEQVRRRRAARRLRRARAAARPRRPRGRGGARDRRGGRASATATSLRDRHRRQLRARSWRARSAAAGTSSSP